MLISLPLAGRLSVLAIGDVTGGLATHSLARLADGVVSLVVLGGLNTALLVLTVRKIARAARRRAW